MWHVFSLVVEARSGVVPTKLPLFLGRMPRNLPPAPSMPPAQTTSNPKAELQDIDGFKVVDIGRDVIVNGIGSGIIRFVGLHAANGEPLVGVEYNKPKGKHNGTLHGVHYFECDADKGTLASPSDVTFNDGPDRRSTITSAPAFNGAVQPGEAAPKKGWKAFSGNVASKMKGVSNVAGKMKGAKKASHRRNRWQFSTRSRPRKLSIERILNRRNRPRDCKRGVSRAGGRISICYRNTAGWC